IECRGGLCAVGVAFVEITNCIGLLAKRHCAVSKIVSFFGEDAAGANASAALCLCIDIACGKNKSRRTKDQDRLFLRRAVGVGAGVGNLDSLVHSPRLSTFAYRN